MSNSTPEERFPGSAYGFTPLVDTRVLQAIVAIILLLRLLYAFTVPPNSGEAYYWLWGQHLQWSYHDHGPLTGWISALGGLAGWSVIGLRWPTLLTTGLTLWIFWVWSARLLPQNREQLFWALAATYLTSPLMIFVTGSVYQDHILAPLSLAALHFLCIFLADWRAGSGAKWRDLFLGAAFMGLAGLAKYNAVFLGFGLVFAVLWDARLRQPLRTWQLYAAAALTAAILSPIAFWNAAYGFPSLQLHAADRFAGEGHFTLAGLVQVGLGIIALSPFLLWPLARFLTAKNLKGPVRELQALSVPMFILSTGLMLALASWSLATRQVQERWNLMALLPFMLVTPLFIRSRLLLGAHLALGTLLAVAAMVFALLTPLPENALGLRAREPQRLGLEHVAAVMLERGRERGVDFYAAPDWTLASRIGFAAGPGPIVTSLSPLEDQFDLFFPAERLSEKSAIVVVQGRQSAQDLDLPFDEVRLVEVVEARHHDIPVGGYTLIEAQGYRPHPSVYSR